MPKTLRIVLLSVLSGVLGLATLAAVLGSGFAVTMSQGFHVTAPAAMTPAPRASSDKEDRIPVAILLGANGSVATDVLGPYGVLASSPRFHVFTVSVRREPVALSGGLTAIPDYSVKDVLDGVAPQPAIIVNPAMSDP
ncbi:hypothetical protein [Arthrobacter bambusae]|uniref:Intracellular protease/amidase n=1 Tax=Arthrobacter bambusae TaxID=1338426 RepID=A0AAW8DJP2_9MICC|nr:hypothetical protein [Arthrobacter bambusae]MDP9906212.1 putative intracellular protease/amidase [Arthrobacter bambusae]MDQ0130555.1 putative intracellular protease/amidase [Arthrobacter bambusae]MDQ0182230.1 putative intracellular protease/amidase [Arthrobacter bambusae]